jgi:hypothetical protein
LIVTTGLDPVVHADVRLSMDCRIKSGNDESFGTVVYARSSRASNTVAHE